MDPLRGENEVKLPKKVANKREGVTSHAEIGTGESCRRISDTIHEC